MSQLSNCFELTLVESFRQKTNLTPQLSEEQFADLLQILSLVENDALALEWTAMHTALTSPHETRILLEQSLCVCPDAQPNALDIHKAALCCALRTLPAHLSRFLHDLSVFEEGWSVEAARDVCNAPDAEDWCAQLLDRHLISVDATRQGQGYRLIAWVRTRLLAAVEEPQRTALQQAHKAYFFRLACEAAPHLRFTPDAAWMARLEADKANLLAAIAISWDTECLHFGLALWRWGYVSAHIADTNRFLHMARFAVPTLPAHLEPEMYRALGSVFYRESNFEMATLYLEDGYHAAERQENWEEAAFNCQVLAIMVGKNGQIEKARSWIEHSLCLWEKAGSIWGQAAALNEKATLAFKDDQLNEAKHCYLKSSKLFEQINDKLQTSKILNNMGLLAEKQLEYKNAESAYRCSIQCRKDILDKRSECETLNNLANVCFKQQKFRQSNVYFCKTLVLMEKIGYTSAIPCALVGLGESAHKQGKDKFAVLCFSLADKLDSEHMNNYNLSERQVLEQTILEIRRTLRPQLYGQLRKKGQNLLIKQLLSQLPD